MAIYKNREVTVGSLTIAPTPDAQIMVTYTDGISENVKVSQIKFTEDEKKNLQKQYPSQFDAVETVSDADVNSVRLGNPPSYDVEAQKVAEDKLQKQKVADDLQKSNDLRDAEAKKKADADAKAQAKK